MGNELRELSSFTTRIQENSRDELLNPINLVTAIVNLKFAESRLRLERETERKTLINAI